MAEHHRTQHHVLGQLACLGLDHQHRRSGTRDHQLQLGILQLGHARVEQVLAALVADLGRADRAVERRAGQRQCCGGAKQGEDVAIHFRVHRHHRGDDLHLVAEAIGEQRTDRAVDQARDQRLLLALASFTLEEATRDAAAGVELLLVVDGQREEVLPFARGLVGDGADQQHGAFARDHHGPACLARDLAGFEGYLVLAVLEGLGDFRHVDSLGCILLGWTGRGPCRSRVAGSVRPLVNGAVCSGAESETAAHHCAAVRGLA